MNWLKAQYQQTAHFFRIMLLKPLCFCIFLMFTTIAGYWWMLAQNPEILEQIFQGILQLFDEKSILIDGKISTLLLLANNLIAVFLSMILGLIPFLFLPLWTLGLNMGIIGAMGAVYHVLLGKTVLFWAGILPHGIFEFPAILLGAAAGLRLNLWMIGFIFHRKKSDCFSQILMECLRFYVLVIAPLLLAASIVEAKITPLVMQMAAG